MYTEQFIPTVKHPYGYIYVTTNTKNNMRYCGKHKSTQFDPYYIGSGTLLKSELEKYEKEDFTCIPIDWASSAEELHQKEVQWIQKLNAATSPNWYNLIEDSNKCARVPHNPPHIKIYLNDQLNLLRGLSSIDYEILFQLFNWVTPKLTIQLTTNIKKDIIQHTSISTVKSLEESLDHLQFKSILKNIYKNAYVLNPFLFGKGNWDSTDNLRHQFQMSPDELD